MYDNLSIQVIAPNNYCLRYLQMEHIHFPFLIVFGSSLRNTAFDGVLQFGHVGSDRLILVEPIKFERPNSQSDFHFWNALYKLGSKNQVGIEKSTSWI